MTKLFNKKSAKQLRQKLRKNSPSAESFLWYKLRNRQILGFKFRRQYSIDRFIVDFYCPKAKLVIELDGSQHTLERHKLYDEKRSFYFKGLGIRVIRFWDNEVFINTEGVLGTITNRLTSPQPSPL
ncbi:MAG: endonuclease domain-containing protein [Patescibacteria group bacterium]